MKWIYIDIWPNNSNYADGGWNAIYGPFDTEEELNAFCQEHNLNPNWGEQLIDPANFQVNE